MKESSANIKNDVVFRSIYENSPFGIIVLTYPNRLPILVNQEAINILGYALNELQHISFDSILYSDDLMRELECIKKLSVGELPYARILNRYFAKSGSLIQISLHLSFINGVNQDSGFIVYTMENNEFIATEKVDVEIPASELRYERLFNTSPVCIHEIDLDGCFITMNPAGLVMLGLTEVGQIKGKYFCDVIADHDRERIANYFQQACQGEHSEFQFVSKVDNRIFKSGFVPIKDNEGQIGSIMGLTQDITSLSNALAQLKESSSFQEALLDTIDGAMILMDADGIILSANQATASRFGLTIDQLIGKDALTLLQDDLAQYWQNKLEEAISIGLPLKFLQEYEEQSWSNTICPIFDSDNKLVKVAAYSFDVTENKQLRYELELKNFAIDQSINGVAISDLEGKIFYANKSFLELWKYSDRDQVIGKSVLEFWKAPADAQCVVKAIMQSGFWEGKLVANRFDSTEAVFQVSARMLFQSNAPSAMMASFVDITEKEQKEKELKDKEKLLSMVFEAVPVGVFLANVKGEIIYANKAGNEIWGGEVTGKSYDEYDKYKGWWYSNGQPLKGSDWAMHLALLNGEKKVKELIEIEDFKGKRKIINHSGGPILNEKNEIIGGYVIADDITEREQSKKNIEKTNKELKEILEALDQSSLVSITDKTGTIVKVNKRFCEIAGYQEHELLGKNHNIISSQYHDKEFWSTFWKTISHGKVWRGEIKNKAKDGTEYWVDTVINPIWNEHGILTHFLSIRQDITTQKEYEKLLLDSNLRLTQIERYVDLTMDAVSVSDEQGQFVYINSAASDRLGIPQSECNRYRIWDIEAYFKSESEWLAHVTDLKTRNTFQTEGIHINRITGKKIPVEITVRYVSIQDNGFVIAVSRDITERKKAEVALHESESRLSEAQQMAKIGYWELDLITNKVWWSEEQYRINGISKSELPVSQDDFINMIHPEDRETFMKIMNNALLNRTDASSTYRIIEPNGQVKVIYGKAQISVDADGLPIRIAGVNQDITERILAEKALYESEQTLRRAQEVAKVGSWKLDVKNDILQWSDQAYKIFNVPAGNSLTYEDFLSFIHPEDKDLVDRAWTAALNGANYDIVHRIIIDSKVKWVKERAELTFNQYNNLIYGLGTVQDITEQVLAEKALQESDQTLRRVQAMAKIGSWKLDVKNDILIWSEETCRIFNVPPGTELNSNDFYKYVHPEEMDAMKQAWTDALNDGGYDVVHRIIVNDKIKWVRQQAELTFDDLDNLIYGFGTIQDITNQVTLRDTNHIFNQSQSLAGIGSWKWSVKSQELFWSDSVYNIFGIDKEKTDPTRETYLNSIYQEDRLRVDIFNREIHRSKYNGTFELEYRIALLSGELRWIQEKGNVSTDEEGNPLEMYGIIRDITQDKNRSEDLIAARKEAEEAILIKDEFLSVMSHEIRTPLNSVIGLSGLLLKRRPRQDQEEILNTLKGAADNLLHLVNDILDFSKIRADKIELEQLNFNVTKFLEQLQDTFVLAAQEKRLDFTVQADPRIPEILQGDVTRLNQVFNNLLGNAIKFTRKGYVKLEVELKEVVQENTCSLLFRITDSGVGIPADKQAHIFLPFQQSERSTTREFGGTGLGLSIVKSLVELMNGTIDLQSEINKGSVFSVELTFQMRQKSEESALLQPSPDQAIIEKNRTLEVLYVEDVESNRFLVENILQDYSINCTAVSSGAAALKFTKARKFDVILMDIQMPRMDGYQVTHKIRNQRGGVNKQTAIIAFTAKPYSEALKLTVMEHGIQDLLSKPFDTEILIKKIRNLSLINDQPKSFYSFSFYERAFDNDEAKLGVIKKTVIKDLKRFDTKLLQYHKKEELEGIKSEIHKMRPIIKNLACQSLYDILNEYTWPEEDYTSEAAVINQEIRSLVKKLLKELAALKY